jgi:type IX secretion system PorP/SprF family membrane protein
MIRSLYLILFLIVSSSLTVYSQETDHGPGFQTVLMHNPAYSGIEGDGKLRLSYMSHYPGNNYNLHSVYASYDSYFPGLHGGAGFYLSDDYLGGIVNDVRGGLSYSYYLQAGKELFINAGLSASVYYRGFNFGGAVFPDQIDPLGGVVYPSSEMVTATGKTAFDLGAGFVMMYRKLFGAFSVSHLAEPDLSDGGSSADRLMRKYNLELAGFVSLNGTGSLRLRPLLFLVVQDDYYSASAGTLFESSYFAANATLMGDNNRNLNLETGFSLSFGQLSLFYNYRFNLSSNNTSMPLSLLHQTGLALRLNKIEKRNDISTINYPKM